MRTSRIETRELLVITDVQAMRWVDVTVLVIDQKQRKELRSKNLLCLIDGELVEIPESCIQDTSDVSDPGDEGDLVIEARWARQKGLD